VERPADAQSPGTKNKADKELKVAIPKEEKKDEEKTAARADDDD